MTKTMNNFKRFENGKIILDGVIYDEVRADKSSAVLNAESGLKIQSIKIDDKTYYPVGIQKEKKK